MKKQSIISIVAILVLSLIVGGSILYMLCNPKVIMVSGAEQFKGRTELKNTLTDCQSYLLTFPDIGTNHMEIKEYYCEIQEQLFDDVYDVYLDFVLNKAQYTEEKKRIESLCLSYEGREQCIKGLDDVSDYDVYVATWDKNKGCEYVMFDDKSNRVICIYTQYHWPEESKYPKEYLLDEESVTDALGEEYSMYWFKVNDKSEVKPVIEQ